MNSCCTQYYTIPGEVECELLEPIEEECSTSCGCNCGYIQYESLAPFITKLSNSYTRDDEHINLEAKLRKQIVEVSRLFDLLTKSEPGAYSKAHYKIIKLYGDGSSYLKIPKFVDGTLELYTLEGYKINPNSYIYKDGYLVLSGCQQHNSSCGCTNSCGRYEKQILPAGWKSCLQAKAKFGESCSNEVVQLAVRMYIIENNTYGDVKEVNFQGLPVGRKFAVPHSWTTAVETYRQLKTFKNQFAFA